jgi:opacity protein-like surface antigen
MTQKNFVAGFVFLVLLAGTLPVWAQETGEWALAVSGNYSLPVAGLTDWFKPAANLAISLGQQYREKWFVEGALEYAQFDQENLNGYPAGRLELELRHVGLLVNGKYRFVETGWLQPFFYLGGGIYQTESLRGEIQADSVVTPFVPLIPAKKRSETNWGFRSGVGVSLLVTPRLHFDVLGFYRLVVGDLWPTLQPNIELEGVSGFQTGNLSLGVRYFF